jgi:predicted MFS family arabinose efflux permease
LISGVVFIEMFSANMTKSALILFSLEINATILEINLIKIIVTVLSLFLQIPFGILSDRFGRKPLLLIPQATAFGAALIRSISQEPWHLIASSLLQGLGGASVFTMLLAIIGDLTQPGERPLAISRFYIFSSLGMLTGPFLASLLLLRFPLRLLFFGETVLRLLILGIVFLGIKEPRRVSPDEDEYEGSYGKNIRDLMKKRNMLTVVVMAGCFTFFRMAVETYTPVYAHRDMGLSNSLVASLDMIIGAAILTSRLSLETVSRRLGLKRFMLLMLGVCILIGLTLPISRGYLHISLQMFLMGSCIGVLEPMGSIIVAEVTTGYERGFGNSLNHFMKSIGRISTISLVPIAEGMFLTQVFPISAILPLIAIGISSILMESPQRRNKIN